MIRYVRYFLFIFFFGGLAGQLFAETEFSGSLETKVTANVPSGDEYDESPLNAGNQFQVQDFTLQNIANFKLNENSRSAGYELWFQVGQYPISELLIGSAQLAEANSAGTIAGYSDAVSGLFLFTEAYILSLSMLRANISWTPVDEFSLTVGRQSFLTGYGYGWNPVDLANPSKDPRNPNASVRGVDAIKLQLSPVQWLDIKAYTAFADPAEGVTKGTSYQQLLVGSEVSFIFETVEFKLAGLWGGEEKGSDTTDRYPHALGAAFYVDIFGLGFYGEGSLRSRSRRNSPDLANNSSKLNDEITLSGLLGFEYYFETGPTLAFEYFFNGEGWNYSQRNDYADIVDEDPSNPAILGLYQPTQFAQHYFLLDFTIPIYSIETTFDFNFIYAFISQAFYANISVHINLNEEGTLTGSFLYSGVFSFNDSQKNEAWLSPVKHSFSIGLTYYLGG